MEKWKFFYKKNKKNRSGTMLLENIIFLLLNLAFASIIMFFLISKGSGAAVLEQSYSKNIALLIDEGKPVTEMKINMQDAFDLAKQNGISREDIVKINGNIVTVKLSSKGGYQYSFFNNADVTVYPDVFPEKNYIIKINGYK
jgi:hypothetical protein